jgi:hypothetical protein
MGVRDWDIVTSYIDSVTTSLKTVTFPKVQEQVKVKNQGNANLTYTIGSQSGTLTPGQSITINEDISSFTIQAASGTQAFELRAKEKGTEQTEDNSSDVMSLLADLATNVKSNPYNAKGDGVTNDTTAIQTAINDVIASGGGKILIPDGVYLIDNLIIQHPTGYIDWSVHLTIEGTGKSILLANPTATDYTVKVQGDLVNNIFVRSIKFKNLKIAGNKTVNFTGSSQRIDRQGILLRQCQDVYFDDVWISQFAQEGLKLHDVYDSNFIDTQVWNCGQGNADNTYKAALSLTGTWDNSNANYFFGLHVEFCPVMLLIEHGSRHNEFVACKFEQGQIIPNYASQAPIALADSLENSFNSCFFVLNTEDGLNGTNHFIYSNSTLYGSNQNQKRTTFKNCQFATRTGYYAKWYRGSYVSFEGCVFNGTKGDNPFEFNDYNDFKNNKITVANDMSYCYKLTGKYNLIKDCHTIYTSSAPTAGAVMKFVNGMQKNVVEDVTYEGNVFAPYEIDAALNSYLGDTIVKSKIYAYREDTADTTPNLFWGASVISLNYTNFVSIATLQFGYNGQEVILVSRNGNPTIVHDVTKIVLKSGQTLP